MPCYPFRTDVPYRSRGWLCLREEEIVCWVPGCGQVAEYLCDHPVFVPESSDARGRQAFTRTCDVAMCAHHAATVGNNEHRCAAHAGVSPPAPDPSEKA